MFLPSNSAIEYPDNSGKGKTLGTKEKGILCGLKRGSGLIANEGK
jgi:hypothetical protein